MTDETVDLLRPVTWCEFADVPAAVADWLGHRDSMTARLEMHCQRLDVEVTREGFISPSDTGEALPLLPVSDRFWLREVTLYGDGRPWLFGRTVIPEHTLQMSNLALARIGSVPLGRYLFQAGTPERDFINPGRRGDLWARRSRLRLAGHPLLLTEIFLPDAPIYSSLSSDAER
ncbi:chorismate lyase [Lonsdalea britannica]|uniref:chorismate lyase n=1 Tax=Lonsdalea britannica TaxID=1082704 RepID=UPI0026EA2A8D|nr:chorismate lyase [Lonsdalea britannica]